MPATWARSTTPARRPCAAAASPAGASLSRRTSRADVLGLMGQWDPKKFTVEDFAVGFVRFANGATLTLESSFVANMEQNDLFNTQLFGTEGGCQYNPVKMYFERNRTLIDATPVFLPNVRAYDAEVRSFIEAIRDD